MNRHTSSASLSTVLRHRLHSGVTLLEVLIATGVVGIGLLSLAALLPLGNADMEAAKRSDRVASVGRAAFRDLVNQGFLRPENWLYANGPANGIPVLTPSSNVATPYTWVTPPNGGINPPYAPLVLDPLFIANNTINYDKVSVLPYNSSTSLVNEALTSRLVRITLRTSAPCTAMGSGMNTPLASGTTTTYVATYPGFRTSTIPYLTFGLAERFFGGRDDVTFGVSSDKSMRPIANYATISSSLGNMNTRSTYQADGNYSWMALIEPSLTQVLGGGNPMTVRNFKVTVVVFYKRPYGDITQLPAGDLPAERSVGVSFPMGGSRVRGNTVEAYLEAPTSDQTLADKYLRVRPDQWIMVKVSNPIHSFYGGGSQTLAYWYRVISASTTVESSPTTPGNFARAVRLSGPDWPYPAGSGSTPGGTGLIMDGAFGVYERMVTTDGTSVWGL